MAAIRPSCNRCCATPILVRALGYAMRRESQSVDKQTAAEWEKWTDTHFHDGRGAPQGNSNGAAA